jgi:glycosyltransferase involved in cell wall biosynthesis
MKPQVSVATITYNHAPFISRCIESVLMQKTTFPFELVIGEDCSTDGTRALAMDYAQKYPQIIRVITSDANVGSNENLKRTVHASQGEFIAFCEGDDYWVDPLKLQKQYEVSVKQDAVLVAHATIMVFYQDGKLVYEPKFRRAQTGSGFLGLEDIIMHRAPFHTSSEFLRAEIAQNLPDWYYQMPVGDFPLKVIAASLGKVYYLDEIMSVYQKGVPGSFTQQTVACNVQEMEREKGELKMYSCLEEYTGHKYTKNIQEYLDHRKMEYYALHGNLDYLELNGFQDLGLRCLAFLIRPVPNNIKKKILGRLFSGGRYSLDQYRMIK